MKMQCEMGMVLACQVETCSYNQKRECQAGRIEVGDRGTHAACDTFTTETVQQRQDEQPMVANCDVQLCKFNNEEICQAPAVSLGRHETHAECDSFVPD